MKITPLKIPDLLLIESRVFKDARGYFFESYNHQKFKEATGLDINFIQDNESLSSYGVLRGLHFQQPPFEQAKLIRVIKGEVLDVAVDIRPHSPTYGQYVSVVLNEDNKHQLFIPIGFAHAYIVLSKEAIFAYKVDNKYAPDSDNGIIYNDSTLAIDWLVNPKNIQLSSKDALLGTFRDYTENPVF